MTNWMINRRDLLRGIGAGAVLLHPMFRSFHAMAQSGTAPKRCIFLFSPNGSIVNAWRPKAGYTFNNGDILEPLAPYKQYMTVLDGMANKAGGAGDAHTKGIGTMLSGKPLSNTSDTGYSSGITIDQYIADALQGQTPYHSLVLGAGVKAFAGKPNRTVMTVNKEGQPIFPNNNPQQIFDLIFGGFTPPAGTGGTQDTAALDKVRGQKASVLDFVNGELTSLRAKLGKEERKKIDEHLEAVRTIESNLQQPLGEGASAGCSVPGRPNGTNKWSNGDLLASTNYAAITKAQIDIMVQSMACDLTRVGSLVWNGASGLMNFGFLGGTTGSESHHGFSHGNGPDPVGNLTKICRWYAQQVAYLVGELARRPEGDGSMLDNTIIFWGSDLTARQTNNHSQDEMPYVLIGNLGGYFNQGRHARFSGDAHSGVLADICLAMGLNDHPYGKAANGLKKA